jgi:hypothetical protein
MKRPRPAKQIERGRGRGLDGPRKLDPVAKLTDFDA